jgi:hypothetical protein
MVELPDAVPESVRDIFERFGGVHIPSGRIAKEMVAIYQRGNEGRCMLCERPLGTETIVKVNVVGIDQVYCSHLCDTDMQLMGWISQQYDDVKERVEFRGTARPDGPPSA